MEEVIKIFLFSLLFIVPALVFYICYLISKEDGFALFTIMFILYFLGWILLNWIEGGIF